MKKNSGKKTDDSAKKAKGRAAAPPAGPKKVAELQSPAVVQKERAAIDKPQSTQRPAGASESRPPVVAVPVFPREPPQVKEKVAAQERDAKPAALAKKAGKRSSREFSSKLKIPPLLLEGDLPAGPGVSGPGARYALAPQPVTAPRPSGGDELPEAYGTGRVFLAARDPHWLYVSWDFTTEQQQGLNAQSRDGHLVIRIFATGEGKPVVPEVHVHPESKNWFVHVPHAATSYRAEIGYYDADQSWRSASVSHNTFTPPEAPSTDVRAEFATIPAEVTFQQVVEAMQEFVSVSSSQPLLEAVALAAQAERNEKKEIIPNGGRETQEPRRNGKRGDKRSELPIEINPAGEWTPEQSGSLARLIHIDSYRRVWMGSMEITELVRRQLEEEISSIAAAGSKGAVPGRPEVIAPQGMNISSPAGGDFPRQREFWFKINAELVVYGATEPDARVTIADRPIKLRPDGTFSFRFSLPDGRYQLPAVAISRDEQDGREARLEFSRATEYRGKVEAHSQDTVLRSPGPEHVD